MKFMFYYLHFLLHGYSPDSMILGIIIPIPKDKRTSLCDSSNYRAIALSSMFSKVLDWIILLLRTIFSVVFNNYN